MTLDKLTPREYSKQDATHLAQAWAGLISETGVISGKHIWVWNPVRGREKAKAATSANPGRAQCWQQQTHSPIPRGITCRGSQRPPRSESWCSHTYSPGLLGRLSEARLGHFCSPAKPTLQAVSLAFSIFSLSILKFYLFTYFFTFLDVLSLCCCTWTFSSCGEQSLLPSCSAQVSLWWLLLLQKTSARATGFSSCGEQALVALRHVKSSRTRDWTHGPCTGRRILNPWTTREVLYAIIFVI